MNAVGVVNGHLAHTLQMSASARVNRQPGRVKMKNLLVRLRREEEAATAVEYAIIAAVVGVALIATLILFRDSISNMLQKAAGIISNQ